MNLPTLLVLFFLVNGEVYQEVQVAPSRAECIAVLPNVKDVLKKALGHEPEAYAAACVTLKPFTRDT